MTLQETVVTAQVLRLALSQILLVINPGIVIEHLNWMLPQGREGVLRKSGFLHYSHHPTLLDLQKRIFLHSTLLRGRFISPGPSEPIWLRSQNGCRPEIRSGKRLLQAISYICFRSVWTKIFPSGFKYGLFAPWVQWSLWPSPASYQDVPMYGNRIFPMQY